jgi:hypothetical protein
MITMFDELRCKTFAQISTKYPKTLRTGESSYQICHGFVGKVLSPVRNAEVMLESITTRITVFHKEQCCC